MRLINYFNPFIRFGSVSQFNQKSKLQKVTIVSLTVLATAFSLPIFGLAGLATFRKLSQIKNSDLLNTIKKTKILNSFKKVQSNNQTHSNSVPKKRFSKETSSKKDTNSALKNKIEKKVQLDHSNKNPSKKVSLEPSKSSSKKVSSKEDHTSSNGFSRSGDNKVTQNLSRKKRSKKPSHNEISSQKKASSSHLKGKNKKKVQQRNLNKKRNKKISNMLLKLTPKQRDIYDKLMLEISNCKFKRTELIVPSNISKEILKAIKVIRVHEDISLSYFDLSGSDSDWVRLRDGEDSHFIPQEPEIFATLSECTPDYFKSKKSTRHLLQKTYLMVKNDPSANYYMKNLNASEYIENLQHFATYQLFYTHSIDKLYEILDQAIIGTRYEAFANQLRIRLWNSKTMFIKSKNQFPSNVGVFHLQPCLPKDISRVLNEIRAFSSIFYPVLPKSKESEEFILSNINGKIKRTKKAP